MKIWILSDLHLEVAKLRQPLEIPEADVCICAGDLMPDPGKGVEWLAQHVARTMPVIYIAGNHEFYRGAIKEGLASGRAASSKQPRVHFLENDSVVIGSVRFVGATLWTDYKIMGGSPEVAMFHAKTRMNDYKMIAKQKKPWERFRPEFAFRIHQDSRQFIMKTMEEETELPVVVVTHHLPSKQSFHVRYGSDLLNAAYGSDLESVIENGRPALWVHGHIHDSTDYLIGDTRVVCNPRGYVDENRGFDPAFVVEVDSPAPSPGLGGGR
ncbi:metallophosphoesterase [Mesorhizobium sp. A623]